jgi:hypothetical protein
MTAAMSCETSAANLTTKSVTFLHAKFTQEYRNVQIAQRDVESPKPHCGAWMIGIDFKDFDHGKSCFN